MAYHTIRLVRQFLRGLCAGVANGVSLFLHICPCLRVEAYEHKVSFISFRHLDEGIAKFNFVAVALHLNVDGDSAIYHFEEVVKKDNLLL